MTHPVFVYGTLKRGHVNSPLLEGSAFLGEAVTLLTYKAVTIAASGAAGISFPVIIPDPGGRPVAGEIYGVDDATLARLDQLERVGRAYDRVTIDVRSSLSNGTGLITRAFIYVGREDRFGEIFARGPLYDWANARGELDWRAG
jgi:gamma-glutamylcyclotransferase (GGCT)/AIG2-like uncharacterized protein YtfP